MKEGFGFSISDQMVVPQTSQAYVYACDFRPISLNGVSAGRAVGLALAKRRE